MLIVAVAEVSGASALYLQELSGVASSAQVRVEGAEWPTGDMVLVGRAGDAAFTGVQAVSFNTGVASVVQSAVCVAAHAVRLAPAP